MSVTLRGKMGANVMEHTINLNVTAEGSESAPIHRLAAKIAIKELEEKPTGNTLVC